MYKNLLTKNRIPLAGKLSARLRLKNHYDLNSKHFRKNEKEKRPSKAKMP